MTDKNKKIDSYWQELVEKNSEIANELAKDYGYESAKELMEQNAPMMNSNNKVVQSRASKVASDFTSQLSLLILYQAIETPRIKSIYDEIANFFDDGTIESGNSKQYTIDIITGSEQFEESKFIPDKITNPSIHAKLISMYKQADVLSDTAYKFKKTLTIRESQWVPFFMSGKLSEFIEKITINMIKSYQLFKFDRIAQIIKNLNPSKVINGTAPNAFEALSTEFFPNLESMLFIDNDYTYDKDNYPICESVDKMDLVVICGIKMRAMLRSGVLSQLYNAKFTDLESNVNSANLFSLGKELNISTSDSSTPISNTETDYVNEDTIIVFDRDLIKHLLQINKNESQAFANNLTIQLTLHVWGVVDILPWKKCFKYTNANLLTLPNGASVQTQAEPILLKSKKK